MDGPHTAKPLNPYEAPQQANNFSRRKKRDYDFVKRFAYVDACLLVLSYALFCSLVMVGGFEVFGPWRNVIYRGTGYAVILCTISGFPISLVILAFGNLKLKVVGLTIAIFFLPLMYQLVSWIYLRLSLGHSMLPLPW